MRKYIVIAVLLGVSLCSYGQDKKVILSEKPNRSNYVDYSTKESSFWCAAQIGSGFGDTAFLAQLDIIGGYRFSEFLRIGIGVSPRLGLKSIPLYFDARGNIISQVDRMHSFYWNAEMGYAIDDGIYLSPGLGMRFGGIRHNVLVSVNYTMQGFKDVGVKHFAGVRIGYEF